MTRWGDEKPLLFQFQRLEHKISVSKLPWLRGGHVEASNYLEPHLN